jgi:hypothetical protein
MTRHFSRWFGKTDLSVEALCRSVDEMERGLIDANLGGGIIKKRVALPGRGKRGSARTLVATNSAIDGSSYLDLKRMIETISMQRS